MRLTQLTFYPIISCSVEYLHFGGKKAEGRRQKAEGKERLKAKSFFITDYPNMILP
ncbi:MAG: hypothetical protein F6K17_30945 [Okeania sp. SIO3C4]|nr:hypothetical protein [Okeania sp. SIO3C4]